MVFWNTAPCISIDGNQHFEQKSFCHHHSSWDQTHVHENWPSVQTKLLYRPGRSDLRSYGMLRRVYE
jgi:hypothetical protein